VVLLTIDQIDKADEYQIIRICARRRWRGRSPFCAHGVPARDRRRRLQALPAANAAATGDELDRPQLGGFASG